MQDSARDGRRDHPLPRHHARLPDSTTHTIVGVGSVRRAATVRWGVAGNIVWAWIFTIPASAFVAAVFYAVSLVLF